MTSSVPKGTGPPGPSSRPEYKGKRLVALKRMKKAFEGGWDECMKLKELKVSSDATRSLIGPHCKTSSVGSDAQTSIC